MGASQWLVSNSMGGRIYCDPRPYSKIPRDICLRHMLTLLLINSRQQISDACCGVSHGFGKAMGVNEAVTPVFPNSDYW